MDAERSAGWLPPRESRFRESALHLSTVLGSFTSFSGAIRTIRRCTRWAPAQAREPQRWIRAVIDRRGCGRRLPNLEKVGSGTREN